MTLKELYTYHPTTPTTAPRYARLDEAFSAARSEVNIVIGGAQEASHAGLRLNEENFKLVSHELYQVALVVEEQVPASRDRDLAQDALREARMWANKALVCVRYNVSPGRHTSLFHTKLEEAQMWANSAVANYTREQEPAPEDPMGDLAGLLGVATDAPADTIAREAIREIRRLRRA